MVPAVLRGAYLVHFSGFPGLYEGEGGSAAAAGSSVEGELVWVPPRLYDETVADLDRLEGGCL